MPACLPPPIRPGGGLENGEPGWNPQGMAISGLCIYTSGLKGLRKLGQRWGKVWKRRDASQRRGAKEDGEKGK